MFYSFEGETEVGVVVEILDYGKARSRGQGGMVDLEQEGEI